MLGRGRGTLVKACTLSPCNEEKAFLLRRGANIEIAPGTTQSASSSVFTKRTKMQGDRTHLTLTLRNK